MKEPVHSETPITTARLPRWAVLFLAVLFLYHVGYFAYGDMLDLICRIPDDASYFFQIATNVAAGNGLTFDGLHPTNGFQPLWLYTLVPWFRLITGEPETMVRVVMVGQAALVTAASGLVGLILYRTVGGWAAGFSLVVFVFLTAVPALNGMESGLLIFMMALVWYWGMARNVLGRREPAGDAVFGLLLGLLMLTRLDMVFWAAALCCGLAWQSLVAGDSAARLRQLLRIVGCASLVVLPYLVFNLSVFDDVVPISGRLKSDFPDPSINWGMVSALQPRYMVFAAGALVYLVWFLVWGRRGPERIRYLRAPLAVLAAGIVVHSAYTVLFMHWGVFSWHFIGYAVFAAMAMTEPCDRILQGSWRRRFDRLLPLALAGLIGVGCAQVYWRDFRRLPEASWAAVGYQAALWARESTPPDAIFAIRDAGHFGYFSGRRVINLDGIVNTAAYQDVLRQQRLHRYLSRNNVRYLAHFNVWSPGLYENDTYERLMFTTYSRMYQCESDAIPLTPDQEVYREPVYRRPDGQRRVFIIWRLDS